MGGIYELRCSDALRGYGIPLHKEWFCHSRVGRGDTQIHGQYGDCISLFNFFEIRKVSMYFLLLSLQYD
jgi:hypothetical protein